MHASTAQMRARRRASRGLVHVTASNEKWQLPSLGGLSCFASDPFCLPSTTSSPLHLPLLLMFLENMLSMFFLSDMKLWNLPEEISRGRRRMCLSKGNNLTNCRWGRVTELEMFEQKKSREKLWQSNLKDRRQIDYWMAGVRSTLDYRKSVWWKTSHCTQSIYKKDKWLLW